MCAIDDGDICDFISEKIRTARKGHNCHECWRDILPGEKYRVTAIGINGSVETNKRCRHCEQAASWLTRHCNGYIYSGIKEEIEEHYREGYREDQLQRILIGINRKWQAFRGDGLLPVLEIFGPNHNA